MARFQKNNQKRVTQQAVFRVLYSNWALGKMYRKVKSGSGESDRVTKDNPVQLKETLEVVDGTKLVFADLQQQMARDFYAMFVKSTDSAFTKKQNSFVLFKTNLQNTHKNKKALFTVANCYFRLKNLVHEDLPRLQFLSELERDGDLIRLKELERTEKIGNLAKNLKDLELIVDKGEDGHGTDENVRTDVEKWVEQSIADCVLKFRKTLTKTIPKTQKKNPSFRAKFKSQQLKSESHLNYFLFSLDRPSKGPNQKVFLARPPELAGDLDAHLLLFYRLLAIKYRLANPLSGGRPWTLSDNLASVLDSRMVASGLKYLVLLRTCSKSSKDPRQKGPLRQPRFK